MVSVDVYLLLLDPHYTVCPQYVSPHHHHQLDPEVSPEEINCSEQGGGAGRWSWVQKVGLLLFQSSCYATAVLRTLSLRLLRTVVETVIA